jgi:D-glycerate 3-kinase
VEREQDPEGSWRAMVNQELAARRADLQRRVDHFWYLRVPDWNCVLDWRWQQEQELTDPRLKSRAEVDRFLASFERIVGHMQTTCADWADCVLTCDRSHRIEIKR